MRLSIGVILIMSMGIYKRWTRNQGSETGSQLENPRQEPPRYSWQTYINKDDENDELCYWEQIYQ